jgi:hypothetical protein
MNPDVFKSLEDIIESGLEDVALPYINGNSIRIKHIIVRKSKNGWLVYNSKTHLQVARLFAKTSAVAMAKSLAEGKSRKDQILELDKVIQKNYTDCMFYKNTLEKCADTFKRAVTQSRLESSMVRTKRAKQSLDSIIFR